jgi:peptidylamidoglycolate lyase
MRCSFLFLWLSITIFYSCTDAGQPGPGTGGSGRYRLATDWPQLPHDYLLGDPSGIGVDHEGNVIVFHRAGKKWPVLLPFSSSLIAENTVLVLDARKGKVIAEWGAGIFVMPHSLTIDRDDNIWVTDVGLHQVLKFDHQGKLLMTVGIARVPGSDSLHFNRPTDVAVAADGSFFVSDGYRNTRVVKFSPAGNYLFSWGIPGKGEGQFDLPHGLDLDAEGNVYVADRENSRIQIFDPGGRFVREWKDNSFGKIYAIRWDKKKQYLFCSDFITNYITSKGSDIMVFDREGKMIARFGRSGNYDGPVCRYHCLVPDGDGNIYAGDILNDRLQKFERLPASRR